MNQEKTPESMRLAEALENNQRWHVLTDDECDSAAAELRRLHAENSAQRAELVTEAARTAEEKLRADQMEDQHRMQCNISKSAVATLVGLGYTDRGGEQWAPSIGKAPDFNLLDAANARIADLEAQLSAIGAGGVESLRKREQGAAAPDSVIAGALFDFCGYLTTMPKDQAITVSGSHEAPAIVEALKAWAANRRLHLDDADVSGWRVAPAQEHATQLAGQVSDAAYSALQYVEHALAAIANREELVDGAIERTDTIGKASKRAKAALTRLQSVAHHFDAGQPAAPAQAQEDARDAVERAERYEDALRHIAENAFANKDWTFAQLILNGHSIDAARAAQG